MKYFKSCFLFSMMLLCVSCQQSVMSEAEELARTQGAMRGLVKVMADCYENEKPPPLQGQALLEYCTKHNPELRDFFKNYPVRFKYDHGYAVALVCSKDDKYWLMEDINCTRNMALPMEKGAPHRPCEHRIRAEQVCPRLLNRPPVSNQ